MNRIAVFIPGIRGGGAERFACLLAGGLAKLGHDVSLVTGPPEEGEYEVEGPVRRVVLLNESFRASPGGLIRWSRALMERCVQEGVDVCIAVGISPNIVSCMIAGKIRTKFVICERNAPKQDAISIKSRIARFLLYRKADAFVFQTTGAQSFYSKSIQARSMVIPNPVIPGLPEWAPKGRNEIAAVGRLMPQKNYPLMLRSFALVHEAHPDWSLRIFGEGLFHDDYQRLAESLGISDAVVFEGFRSDVHERIAECDIFLMTSDFEGMPNSLLEAMAIGMPCISTDCPAGGPAMLIEHGVNGLLSPIGDEIGISNALNKMIDSEKLRKELALQASSSRRAYSVGRIMEHWDKFLVSLIYQERHRY